MSIREEIEPTLSILKSVDSNEEIVTTIKVGRIVAIIEFLADTEPLDGGDAQEWYEEAIKLREEWLKYE